MHPARDLPIALGVPFAARLADHGERLALITPDGDLTYRELAERVEHRGAQLGTTPRLVLLTATNGLESLVTHLACLAHGHPIIVAPDGGDGGDVRNGRAQQIIATYAPDLVSHRGEVVAPREPARCDPLHPELALLLSTSGTTGSPRLVRLSATNVQANAESIASFLGIRSTDRAITTLPMSYCYGLSVIHSHLHAGAALVLSDHSVVDRDFWRLFEQAGVTSFAAVPYTFDLLDQVGFDQMDLPRLRYLTQAGGALAPVRVRAYAELGRQRGWDLFVMYGQTEATARMAYLPPDLAVSHPASIGRALPGGTLRLDPVAEHPDPEVGELVYAGPNVMLGYATGPTDLARGAELTELRTGDLARRGPDGLLELVGRVSRFAKVFGLRVDLAGLEAQLSQQGLRAHCAESADGRGLVVAVPAGSDVRRVGRTVADRTGLPVRAVRVCVSDPVPRLASGKPDYHAIARQADTAPERLDRDDLLALYATVLGRDDVEPGDTFVGLGGDSLSFVEVSLRLEQSLGHLPRDWPHTPIGDLGRARRRRASPWWRELDAHVALRAIAIVLIVGSHSNVFMIPGGAHVLLAAAGYNFARFHLTGADRGSRVRHMLSGAAHVAIPSMLWIALVAWLTGAYATTTVLLLNSVVDTGGWTTQWQFWFIEAVVLTVLVLAAVLAIPAVDRLERRAPFGFALGVVGLGLLTRYGVVVVGLGPDRIHTWTVVLWIFALGWAAARATTPRRRLLVAGLVVTTVPGFFGDPPREAVVVGGMLALVWLVSVPWPAVLMRITGLVASASLFIYLTHWQVYPYLEDDYPLLGLLASLVVGIAVWRLSIVGKVRLSSLVVKLRRTPARS